MKVFRAITILLLAGALGFLGYTLYEKQHLTYSLLSFRLPQSTTIMVPDDLERSISRLNENGDQLFFPLDENWRAGWNRLRSEYNDTIMSFVGNQMLYSQNDENQVLVFQNENASSKEIGDLLENSFGVEDVSHTEGKLNIGAHSFLVTHYGNFTAVSLEEVAPVSNVVQYRKTNADYLVFEDTIQVDRFVLAGGRQYQLWKQEAKPVRGNAVEHLPFLEKIPTSFDTISFFGSSRMMEDKNTFFPG